MKRRNVWLPGWERKCAAKAAPRPSPPAPGGSPALGHLPARSAVLADEIRKAAAILAAGGELPPKAKKARTGGGPLPVRSATEQGTARRVAALWSDRLNGLDLGAVKDALKDARAEATALGALLEGDREEGRKALAKLTPDQRAEVSLALAAGEEHLRRARGAAIQASFQLGLVKKLLGAGWLPAGPKEIHSADLEAFQATAEWWAGRAKRRAERGPVLVKGAPRPFPRNNF